MMSPLRLATTELRRLSTSRLRRLALLALVVIPSLYGGLYLFANRDPYGSFDNIPAALVSTDTGAVGSDGRRINAGQELTDQLIDNGAFDWQRVTAAEAARGVREGRYDFALTVPRDFSAALVSTERFDPRQARISMVTNDANSYLSTTIADNVADEVEDALAKRVGIQAATSFLLGIGEIRTGLISAADGAARVDRGARQARSGVGRLAAGASQLDGGAARLQSGTGRLSSGLTTLSNRTAPLPRQVDALAAGARRVAQGNREVAALGRRIAGIATGIGQRYAAGRAQLGAAMDREGLTQEQQQRVLGVYDQLGTPLADAVSRVRSTSADLNRLSAGAGRVAEGAGRLAGGTRELVDGIRAARDGAARVDRGSSALAAGAARLAGGADRAARGMDRLAAGAGRLRDGLDAAATQLPTVDPDARSRVARAIADPVAVRSTSHGATSYGAGLAPFFLSLATWIGAYVLFLLARPLSNRALAANHPAWRVALGGWAFPVLMGAAQVGVLFTTVLLGLRIQPVQPVAMLGFLVLVSATFMAMVHTLNAWLGAVGQFLGLVLMIIQLVSAGGTFPWQTLPQPLRFLHGVLPMSYAVDGLRQLMYGGLSSLVLRDVAVLAAYLLGAVALTWLAARRSRIWTVRRIKPELVL